MDAYAPYGEVPAVFPAGLVETQARESELQETSAWLKYSRRRNLLAQQKLPAV